MGHKTIKKLGLVLGRFQPLHAGHLYLIDLAFKENDRVVICIGSAQKAEPLTINKRHQRIKKQFKILGYKESSYSIVDLVDPKLMKVWPEYVKKVSRITDRTKNTFYRAEKLPLFYIKKLKKIGFRIRTIKRIPFYYKAPDGLYYKVTSATEIRSLHKKLKTKIR